MAITTIALGYLSTIEIDTTANDGTFVTSPEFGGWTTSSLTFRRANADSTNVDTAGYEGKEYGLQGLTLTLESLDDQKNDTVQDQILADFKAGTKRWFRVRPRIGTGYLEWIFKGVVSNAAYTMEQNGLVRFSLSVDSDGAVTKQDQT